MTCRDCSEFLSDYLAEQLAPEVRATFELHLSRCPNCVTYLDQFRTAIKAGKVACADAAADLEVPDDLIRAILTARRS